jgi:hypothetical protein
MRRPAYLSMWLCVVMAPLAVATPSRALSPSGEALAVIQATSVTGPGGSRTLSAAKPIYSGDRIKTGTIGEAQIRFLDDTKLVVGPNSSMVIDKFVFNPDKTLAGVTMQMTKGAFRFITGTGPKKAYTIQTPTATLGIRGTKFDVAVGGKFGTGILVFDGAVRMCNRVTGRCTTIDRGCGAAVAAPDGSLASPRSSADRVALIKAAFPLALKQGSLRSDFRVSTRECGLASTPPGLKAPSFREINFSPIGPGPTPGPGPGPSDPPGGNDNPGASGNTNGGSHSGSSNASNNARSDPGNSGNSSAGGKGKGKKG